MNDNLKSFIQDHRINLLDDNKRAYKHTRMNTKFFQYPEDYNKLTATDAYQYESEQLFTIEVSESELTRIAEFEHQVFNNMRDKGHYHMFEHLMEQKERERALRDKYPAVKKAYEHYSLILKLAESGEM